MCCHFRMAIVSSLQRSTSRGCHIFTCILLPSQGTNGSVVPRRRVNYLTDPANTGKRARGVNFDTLGSWNNRLNLPINIEESIRRGQLIPMISLADIGTASLRGRRVNNEDRTLARFLAPNLLMFGIFDGHGGREAADYVVDHLPGHITYWLESGESDLSVVLRRSFIDVNNGFTRLLHHHFINSMCSRYLCLLFHTFAYLSIFYNCIWDFSDIHALNQFDVQCKVMQLKCVFSLLPNCKYCSPETSSYTGKITRHCAPHWAMAFCSMYNFELSYYSWSNRLIKWIVFCQ